MMADFGTQGNRFVAAPQNNNMGLFGPLYDFLDRGRDVVTSGAKKIGDKVEDLLGVDFFGDTDPNAYRSPARTNRGSNDMNLEGVDRMNPVNFNGMLAGDVLGVPVKVIVGGLGVLLAVVVLRRVL